MRLVEGTREESEKIIDLHKQGYSLRKISLLTGRSTRFIRDRIKKYKLTGEIYVPYADSRVLEKEIISLYQQGMNANKIHNKINKSYFFVHKVIDEYLSKVGDD